MQTAPAKKLLIVNILDILRRYTDENHRLSQKQIADLLRTEYNNPADRKTVKRNLTELVELGYEIGYSEVRRVTPNPKTGEPEETYILSDFYLERDFTDAELRLLIDSLLFSKHIPYSQCKVLVKKLEGLSSVYFRSRTKYIRTLRDNAPDNRQLFYTIEIIDEAIGKNKQVIFHYCKPGTDKKMHPERREDGTVREYLVNPYQIVAANGRYYLIGNYDKYDNISHFRMDRITDIRLISKPAKPKKQVRGMEHGLDLPKHMAEHIYLFSGESAPVTFRAKKYIVPDILDWFGGDVKFFDETQDEVSVRVSVNLKAMRRWALQYALHTKVLAPAQLAQQVRDDLRQAMRQYEDE